MKSRSWAVPFLVGALLTGLLTAAIVHRAAFASAPADDFLQLRKSVYTLLQQRVNTPLDGVRINLPPTESSRQRIASPFPDDDHIQRVIRERDWQGGGGFQLLLDLDDAEFPASEQDRSETMAATALLNHYFSVLEKAGLSRRGSPSVVMGKVQSAQNEWLSEQSQSLSVEGVVFVSLESKQAIVIANVRERLARR